MSVVPFSVLGTGMTQNSYRSIWQRSVTKCPVPKDPAKPGREAGPGSRNYKQPRQADFKVSAHKSSTASHVRNNFFFQTSPAQSAQSAAGLTCRCSGIPPGTAQETQAQDSDRRITSIQRAQPLARPLSCSPTLAARAERASKSVGHMVNWGSHHWAC